MYVGARVSLLDACEPAPDSDRDMRRPVLVLPVDGLVLRRGALDPTDEMVVFCELDARVVNEGARSWLGVKLPRSTILLLVSIGKYIDVCAGEASGVVSVKGSITSAFRLLEFDRNEK